MEEIRYHGMAACSRFDHELEAYLEGETRPFIASHAQACTSCGALLADLQAIREAARELPLEEPSRVVWTHVRTKLAAEGAFIIPACLQFADELEAFLEGEVRPFIFSHAQACASCGALLTDLHAIREVAQDLPLVEPSPMLWAKVRSGIEAEGAFGVAVCARFADELEAHMEGDASPFIVSHAQACAPCGALLADLQAIREAARDLPLEEPSRVVWANVRARLEAEGAFLDPVRGWHQILAWPVFDHAMPLAILAILILLGTALTLPSSSVQRWGGTDEAANSIPVTQIAAVTPAGEDGALARVVSDLESNFRANEASMAPDLKATYEKSLVSLDGSIHECLDSLRHEPRNTLAHDYLLTAYTRKAEVLSSALEFEGR